MSVFYGLAVGAFVYKELNVKKIVSILGDSCSTTATVMFITMGATLFGYVLTRARLDLAIKGFMLAITGGNWIIFFLIVNVVLLIAGCFLDSASALYIFTPLFAPVALELGIHPIHLGVAMIVNLAIGLFTPPVGVNLYVACGIGDIKIEAITKGIIPCLIAELVILLHCQNIRQVFEFRNRLVDFQNLAGGILSQCAQRLHVIFQVPINGLVYLKTAVILDVAGRVGHQRLIQNLPRFHILADEQAGADPGQHHVPHIGFHVVFGADHRIAGDVCENLPP